MYKHRFSLMTSQKHLRLDFQRHSAGLRQLYWKPGLLITVKVLSQNWFISLCVSFICQNIQTSKTWIGYSKPSKNLTKHSIVVLHDSVDLHSIVTKLFQILSLSFKFLIQPRWDVVTETSLLQWTLYFSKFSLAKIFILFSSILLIKHAVYLQISEQTTDTDFYNKDVIKVAFRLSSFWT